MFKDQFFLKKIEKNNITSILEDFILLTPMNQVIRKNIYSYFVLKDYLESIVGCHAPFEIIRYICLLMYPRMSIKCGKKHTVLLVDNDVYTWGSNGFGQLGLGHTNKELQIQKVEIKDIEKIDCGEYYTMALNKFGDVYFWGIFSLGIEDYHLTSFRPWKTKLTNIIDIACGNCHALALNTNGEIYSMGNNIWGQLGYGGIVGLDPYKIELENVVAISCSRDNSMAITESGDLYEWGRKPNGKVGSFHLHSYSLHPSKINLGLIISPQYVPSYHHGINFTIVRTIDGELYSRGCNDAGQLGLGQERKNENIVFLEKIKIENIKHIRCMNYSVIAIDHNHKIYTWGENNKGQLGYKHPHKQYLPCQVNLPNIMTISCGDRFVIAISFLGEIWAWGSNRSGELGLGLRSQSVREPEKIPPIIKYDWNTII
jgi:alpha-tubulin suppressor-like RCC1 family protein